MKKIFYVQTDEINRITDVIETPNAGYKMVEIDTSLPYNILGRCYKLLQDNSVIYIPQWDMSEDKQRLNDIEVAVSELIYGGAI